MTSPKRALLMTGSPKNGPSTSEVLGSTLLGHLAGSGIETESVRLGQAVGIEENFHRFLPRLKRADLVILSFPLYADSLPAHTTRVFEWIAAERNKRTDGRAQRFAVIVNCGFPEAAQCDTALAICRCFAVKTGLEWAGGLAMGAGGAVAGRPLESRGRMVKKVLQALEKAAAALERGQEIPAEAVALMAKPIMPARIYLSMGTIGFKRKAKKQGALKRLKDQPYSRVAEEAEPGQNEPPGTQ